MAPFCALLFVFFFTFQNVRSDGGFAIKFKVIHEAIVICPKLGTEDIQFNMQLFKKDRTHMSMRGNLTLKIPLDDNVAVRTKFQTWGNGGWKAGSGVDFGRDDGCTALQWVLGPVWTALVKEMKMANSKCPIKPGSWPIDDFDAANWDNLAIPGAPINKYKLEATFLKRGTKKILGCYSSIFNVVRKS